MKRTTRETQMEAYPQLAKLAAFIIKEKLDFFVDQHFSKCVEHSIISLDGRPQTKIKEQFHTSCERLLRDIALDSGKKSTERSIEDMFEYSLGSRPEQHFTIDDIVMISTIRAESLRTCIKEFTNDVEQALSIVTELDSFSATLNTIAFGRYSTSLISTLKMNNDALRTSNEKLREFAYVVSHDLKAPLRKASTYLDYIGEKIATGDTDAIPSFVSKTQSAARQMQELIDKLLTFATVDNQQPERQNCDLNVVIQEVIENLEPAIRQKKATITVDNLPAIRAARFQMTQLFQNLLSNSLKFCQKDIRPVVQISNEITKKDNRAYLVIVVKDNCIGFSNQYSTSVFSAFTRLHGQYDGTGLGLSICKKIVENHDGTISVDSEEGKGSEFKVELPID
jgi:signal transduction histidine kinase